MSADDLFMFGEAFENQLFCVMETLQKFCILSRQEVNEEKSNILFLKNISRGLRNKLLNISKFRETNQFEKFLGVSISGRNLKRANYQFIIDQVSNRLLNWKVNSLSFASRITLAKSVLEAILIYPMMISLLPKSFLEEIERL